MSAPKDFQSAINEKYGEFGWQLTNCLCFIAEYKGYKVRDFSAIESSLELIDNDDGESMKNSGSPEHFEDYLTSSYPSVHEILIERATKIENNDPIKEEERQNKVVVEFIEYMIGSKIGSKESTSGLTFGFNIFTVDEFFEDYIKNLIKEDVNRWLPEIETSHNH